MSILNTEDFITELFVRVDEKMAGIPKHPQASLWPGEVVTLALLFAVKGVGERAFYRWLRRDWLALFPRLPDRTRLFRLFATHRGWTDRLLAAPTFFGVADTYGIELIHPIREGRSPRQIGKKGKSNRRWIVGVKLAVVLNRQGLVAAWDCATANVSDTEFRPLVRRFDGEMIVLTDGGFHASEARGGDPPNMKVCGRKTWGERMVVETVLSMLTVVSHLKKVGHRAWRYVAARLAYTVAAFNLLVQWRGLELGDDGNYHLSIAEFNL
jgi:hypothetical protein